MENTQPSSSPNQMNAETQPRQHNSKNNNLLVLIVSVLLAVVITGSVVYFWQKSANEKVINGLEQKISFLEEQVSTMKKMKTQQTSFPEMSPTATTDPTANWKTYQNEDVTFKYPLQWIQEPVLIRGSGFTQEFKDPRGKFSLTFSSIGNYNQVTGKPYASLDEYINMPYKVEVVTVDGQEGRRPLPRAGSENINSVVFFSKDSKFLYTLELQTGSTAFGDTPSDASVTDVQEGQKLFNQVISTFKFAN